MEDSDFHEVTEHHHIEMQEMLPQELMETLNHGQHMEPSTSAYLTHPDPPIGRIIICKLLTGKDNGYTEATWSDIFN